MANKNIRICMGIPIGGFISEDSYFKTSQFKSLDLLPLWVAAFLFGYFPDSMRFEPIFLISWVAHHIIKSQCCTLHSGEPTNLSKIFFD